MRLTQEMIFETALRQSAIDANCRPEDFLRQENVVVLSQKDPAARKYLELPLACQLISYGNNIVASVEESCRKLAADYISCFPPYRCFETPHMHILDGGLREMGLRTCFMAEYFLPDLGCLTVHDCPYETRLLHPEDFPPLYTDQWS
ncbi:MAG: GNAT family N-acetyltransferase, partial [Oscillospiraceae bacterium]|nr:GNAT family N-acetyltransferase [Oscillospiraceae bacterium]